MTKEIFDRIDENTWIISDTHFGHSNILSFEPCRLSAMRIDGYNADEHDQWIMDNWNNTVKPESTVLHLGDFGFKNGFYTSEFNTLYNEKYKNVSSKDLKNVLKITKPKSLEEIGSLSMNTEDIEGMNIDQFKSIISKYVPENEYYKRYEDLLNGNIILVLGNHDPKPKQFLNRNIDVIDGFYHTEENILNKVQYKDQIFSGFIKEINGTKYMFTHYDIFTNCKHDKKSIKIAPRINLLRNIFEIYNCNTLVHGHIHSSKSTRKQDINVSFEHLSFRPQKLSEFLI